MEIGEIFGHICIKIVISKFKDRVVIGTVAGYSMRRLVGQTTHRLNSEMTKDLIKEEMRCRVLSFRPDWKDKLYYQTANEANKYKI